MRFIVISLVVFIISITSCKKEYKKKDGILNENILVNLMTYNIRLDTSSDGENAWPNRKDVLSSQILFFSPDILGVQEARPNQMADLKSVLKKYQAIGIGRDGKEQGEYSAIFYNIEKVNVENENTFWLSETPNEVSKGWDAAYPRICTYGLFTFLKNNQKLWVFNTHLDHVGVKAKEEGINLILKKIDSLNTKDYPVVVMGDFNVEPDNVLIKTLKQTMNDSKEQAKITFGSHGTFNGFNLYESVTRRIDYIFVSKTDIEVNKYGVLSSTIDLKYPSDHFPVLAELELK